MPGSGGIVDLISDPRRIAVEIERERAARRGATGWLGITARDSAQGQLTFADGVFEAEIHPRGPAYRARLRTGDAVTAIIVASEKIALDDFYALKLPVRTEIGIEFVRALTNGPRRLATTLKLAPWPRTRPPLSDGNFVQPAAALPQVA